MTVFLFSLFFSSQREHVVCVELKKKNTTALFFLLLLGVSKLSLFSCSWQKSGKHTLRVRIWISDFVCRWFLLHVFKGGTQSRSTISVLPWLSYVWVDVSVLSVLQANTTKAKKKPKDIYFAPFFSCKRKSLNINFRYKGLMYNWHLQHYSKAYQRSATVTIAGVIDWNDQCSCLRRVLALWLLKSKKNILKALNDGFVLPALWMSEAASTLS